MPVSKVYFFNIMDSIIEAFNFIIHQTCLCNSRSGDSSTLFFKITRKSSIKNVRILPRTNKTANKWLYYQHTYIRPVRFFAENFLSKMFRISTISDRISKREHVALAKCIQSSALRS